MSRTSESTAIAAPGDADLDLDPVVLVEEARRKRGAASFSESKETPQ